MSLNKKSINSYTINNAAESFIVEGSGTLIDFEQEVVIIGEGTLIDFEQDVTLLITGEGTLIDFEQEVITTASGNLINFEQQVNDSSAVSFYDKNGFDYLITLGGRTLSKDYIHGNITVSKYENDNASANFTIIPGAGTYDLFSYQGQDVTISVRKNSTNFRRVFTGKVDIPSVNTVEEKITLDCIADRKRLISENLLTSVGGIGYFSENVLGSPNNVLEEVESRLETIPFSLDFDSYNNWSLNSWTPKATADFTYGSSDIYYEPYPQIIIEKSTDIVNKINIEFDYQYQRLHQRQLSYRYRYQGRIFNYPGTYGGNICTKLEKGLTLPRRDMIQQAASATGWAISNMTFTDLWPNGFYNCSGITIGWSSIQTSYRFDDQLDENGNSITDKQGNTIQQASLTEFTDLSKILCRDAQWTARKRFSQNVTEKYSITVQSPQSQSQYSTTEESRSYSYNDEYDSSEWEASDNYKTFFSGTQIQAAGDSSNYYINKNENLATFNQAVLTAINVAKTRILQQHRDSRIIVERDITPELELKHTVDLTGKWVRGKGKVRSLTHTFNEDGFSRTKIETAFYRSVSSATATPLSLPTRPISIAPVSPSNIILQSRWGYDPSGTNSENWDGYVGNAAITVYTGGRTSTGIPIRDTYTTQYVNSFIVKTPEISSQNRDDLTMNQSANYNISISNDDLETQFYWVKPS